MVEEARKFQVFLNEMMRRIDTNTRRIRSIEQRMDAFNLRIKALEEKIIEDTENLKKKLDQLFMDMKEISENLVKFHAEVQKIKKDLERVAKKSELKELESLLELYNPIKSKFVTREEVERMIKERVEEES